jgi:hypothetical protein
VLIYTSWIRIDSQKKLTKLLEENGYRVAVLSSAVPPNRREEWVEKQVADGIQVLITNPSLVETGLDLNDFTTLYFYNIAYNLFTLRQSSRRSWRINQKAPRIEVYFTYYEGTMQHSAVRLMASKLAVAGIIEGNFTDEGLAAMSDCADMTTALVRELTQGIKDEVEDLSAVFKKMEFKPGPELFEVVVDNEEPEKNQQDNEPLSAEEVREAMEELFLDFSDEEVSPVTVFYDPLEQAPLEKEAMQEEIELSLKRFGQLKELSTGL